MIRVVPDEPDLCWYLLGDCRGDLGVRSIQGALQDTLERGTVGTDGNTNPLAAEDALIALIDRGVVRRYARIDRRWRTMMTAHRRTLTAVYGTTRRDLPEWGAIGLLVLTRPCAGRYHASSGTDWSLAPWLARLGARRDTAAAIHAAILDDAHAALDRAIDAWRATGARRAPPRS